MWKFGICLMVALLFGFGMLLIMLLAFDEPPNGPIIMFAADELLMFMGSKMEPVLLLILFMLILLTLLSDVDSKMLGKLSISLKTAYLSTKLSFLTDELVKEV